MPRTLLTNESDIIAESVEIKPSCCVCLLQTNPSNLVPLGSCQCIVCQECLTTYLTERISTCRVDPIECPACSQHLQYSVIIRELSSEQCKRYERALMSVRLNRQVQGDPTLSWCPAPNCNTIVHMQQDRSDPHGVPHKEDGSIAVVCPDCHHDFCFVCKEEAHPGKTCARAMVKRCKSLECMCELEFRKWAKHATKKCPERTCQVTIERNRDRADCNHMTCWACGTEFCWLCRAKIPPLGHFDEDSVLGCPGLQYGGPDIPRKARLQARLRAMKKRGLGRTAVVAAVSLLILPIALPYHGYQLYKALQ